MTHELDGKVAIVVGASSGIGHASAQALAREGAAVVAAARRTERLDELCRQLAGQGLVCSAQKVDVCVRADVERLVEVALTRHARVDLLVYATGTNIRDRALDVLTPESWEMMIGTNLAGAFHCTKAVLPVMRRQGDGLIVYVSSAAVQMPDVSGVAYQASKHGLAGLAHGTRIEEKRNGIRASVIYPGLCDTEILLKRASPPTRDVLEQALAPEDVAAAVTFIAKLPPRAVVPELQVLPARL